MLMPCMSAKYTRLGQLDGRFEFEQDDILQHAILVDILLTNVSQQGRDSISIMTYFLR